MEPQTRIEIAAHNQHAEEAPGPPPPAGWFHRSVRVSVRNAGRGHASDVRATIVAPKGCIVHSTLGDLPQETPEKVVASLSVFPGPHGYLSWTVSVQVPPELALPHGVVDVHIELTATDDVTKQPIKSTAAHLVVLAVPAHQHPAALTMTGKVSDPVVPGSGFQLAVSLGNTGVRATDNTVVRAYLPLYATFTSSNTGGQPVDDGGRTVEWRPGAVAPDKAVELDVTAKLSTQADTGLPIVVDAVAIAANSAAGLVQLQPATEVKPSLTITPGEPQQVESGARAVFQFTVSNSGPSSAQGVRLTATLPAGVAYVDAVPYPDQSGRTVSWELGTVPPGGSEQASVTGHVDLNATGQLACTAVATCPSGKNLKDKSTADGTATATVKHLAALEYAKYSAQPETVIPGRPGHDDVTYSWTVVNRGPSTARDVEVTVQLPTTLTDQKPGPGSKGSVAGTWVWQFPELAPSATQDVHVSGRVRPDVEGMLTATATAKTATRTLTGPIKVGVAALATAEVALALPGGYPSPGKVQPGSDLAFIWTFTNQGPSTAKSVTADVELPQGVVLHSAYQHAKDGVAPQPLGQNKYRVRLGDRAAGATGHIVILTEVKDSASGTLTAKLTAMSTNISAPPPVREVSAKVASAAQGGHKRKSSGNALKALLGALAAGLGLLEFPPFPPGEPGEPGEPGDPDKDDDDDDDDPGNKKKKTNLGVSWKAGSKTPAAGARGLKLTFTVTNKGAKNPAEGVLVSIPVPKGLSILSKSASRGVPVDVALDCIELDIAALGVGQQATLTLTAAVDADPPASVRVIANVNAVNAKSKRKSVRLRPKREAKLELSTGRAKPEPVEYGKQVAFLWTLTNKGPSTATDPTLVVTVPDGLDKPVVKVDGQQVAMKPANSTLTGRFPKSLGPKKNAEISVEGTATGASSGKLTTSVKVSAKTANTVHGSATATVKAVLRLVGSVPGPVIAGGPITYHWSVTNTGRSDAREVEVWMPLPPAKQATFDIASHEVKPDKGQLRWKVGTIAAGVSRSAVAQFQLAHDATEAGLGGRVGKAKAVNSDEASSAEVSTKVGAKSQLSMIPAASPTTVSTGDMLTLTWTIANAGPSDARDLQVNLAVPPGMIAATAVLKGPSGKVALGQPVRIEALVPGKKVTVTLTGKVGAQEHTAIVAIATLAEGTAKPAISATAHATVHPSAWLRATPKDSKVTVIAGTSAELAWTVGKVGEGVLRDAYFFVAPPTGVEVRKLMVGSKAVPVDRDAAQVSCLIADPNSRPVTVAATIAVPADMDIGADLVQAWLSKNVVPPHTKPVDTSLVVTRQSAMTLRQLDSVPVPAVAGTVATLLWDVNNIGPSNAGKLSFTINPPHSVGLSEALVDTHPAELVREGSAWRVTLDAIAADEAAEISVRASIPPGHTGKAFSAPVTLTGKYITVTTTGTDQRPVTRESKLAVAEGLAPKEAVAGSDVNYQWTLTNKGPSTATDVTFEATITPKGAKIADVRALGGKVSTRGTSTVVTWTVSLEPWRAKDFSVVVTLGDTAGTLQVGSMSRLDGKRYTSTLLTTTVKARTSAAMVEAV